LFKLILKIYGIAILIFGFFRSWLFWWHRHEVLNDPLTSAKDIVAAFVWGARYDILITGFIVILPFLLLVVYDFTHKPVFKAIAFWWIFTGLSLAFMLTAANVVYYHKFYQHITTKALEWFHEPAIVFGMIFQEPRYWFMIIPAGLIVFGFYRLLKKIFASYHPAPVPVKKKLLWNFFILFLIFTGIRGRLNHAPFHLEDANRFNNNFLNELILNPVFVFEKSLELHFKNKSFDLHFMPLNRAIAFVQKSFGVEKPVNKNPVSRIVRHDSVPDRKNVVIILMESMAAWKMAYFGNRENRTPFLDSLFLHSMAFTNMYSNGIHTSAGIYGVHFSYPEIFEKHPLRGTPVKTYKALPQTLKAHHYHTVFFIPHNKAFDNLGFFLSQNAFDRIFYEKDYPKDSIRNIWGVDDHFLFNFVLDKLDSISTTGKPFLASILTIADHSPFYLPDFIKGPTERIRATRFADWAIADFMHKASRKPWFKNTIFVLVADHGEGHKRKYPVPLTYNHIPAMIYYQGVKPQIIDKMAGQIDLFPTLMHILNISYVNNTFGIDLLDSERPYIYFNHDNIEGLIDRTHLLLIDRQKTIGLYHYREGDLTNYKDTETAKRHKMETYLKAHLQTAKYILDNDLQNPD